MPSRLASLNLRYNPFGELDPVDRGRVAVGDFRSLADELRQPGTAIQFIGACGRGKSTHLHGVHRELPDARYSRVDRGGPPCSGGIYLMDEADHLGWWRRWRYLRRATSLAVASHRSMGGFLRVCGYRVVDVYVGRVDVERVQRIASERIALAWTGDGIAPEVDADMAQRLVQAYGDDLRAINDALYDWVSGETTVWEAA